MGIKSVAERLAVGGAINWAISAKVIGLGAGLTAGDLGGWQDPNHIDGYTWNPKDEKWYESPAAPDYGWPNWEGPASPADQEQLTQRRKERNGDGAQLN